MFVFLGVSYLLLSKGVAGADFAFDVELPGKQDLLALMQEVLDNISSPTLVLVGSEDNEHNLNDFLFVQNTLRSKNACEVIAHTNHSFSRPAHKQAEIAQKVAVWVRSQ